MLSCFYQCLSLKWRNSILVTSAVDAAAASPPAAPCNTVGLNVRVVSHKFAHNYVFDNECRNDPFMAIIIKFQLISPF